MQIQNNPEKKVRDIAKKMIGILTVREILRIKAYIMKHWYRAFWKLLGLDKISD